uniref:RNase_Zc3h12a domain-containing protein n=1 Tax=Toxocara canis TaxID=6265 RepID=A0A183U882_TOXCA
LWYFISRGHQAQALMPFCFKTYPNKSDNWNELMALFRLNLIEFTPGYGSDKYVEVNRIIAMRAREYGGCMVARSQMQSIVEEQPLLEAIVEKRLADLRRYKCYQHGGAEYRAVFSGHESSPPPPYQKQNTTQHKTITHGTKPYHNNRSLLASV